MQNIPMHMWIVSHGRKKVSCVHVKVGIFDYFMDSVCCHLEKINEKTQRKYKYVQMNVLYTKYKAENNALWTIYVKYGLQIYREVWKLSLEKSDILKWKICRNHVEDKAVVVDIMFMNWTNIQ